MNILLTGDLSAVSYSFSNVLLEQSQIVASSENINSQYIGEIHKKYNHAIGTDEFSRLFSVHSFDAVVFFLGEMSISAPNFLILEKLNNVLSLCSEYDVKKAVVISSTYIYNGEIFANEKEKTSMRDSLGVLLNSCRNLCDSFRKHNLVEPICVYTPTLFGYGENQSFIGKMIYQSVIKNHINVKGQKNQLIETLSLEDLGEFVSRLLLEWPEEKWEYALPGATTITLKNLCELFKDKTPVSRITYSKKMYAAGPICNSRIARDDFDWLPVADINNEIGNLIKEIKHYDNKKPSIRQRIYSFIFSKKFIIVALEIAILYIAMEGMNNLTSTAVQFKFIDFRLLFIMLIAIVHGLVPGITASLLACVSILSAYVSSGVDAVSIVYNIDRWLPFACYIMIGTIIGYIKNNKDKNIDALNDENKNLSQRYAFLMELYDNALSNKDQYKNQIISYRNSFGRIFDVTRRLNTMLPDEVFKEALSTLEDVLNNQTIAIYNTYGNEYYSRLCVCSKKIMEDTPNSLKLQNISEAINQLMVDEVWSNTQRFQGYPDYIFPIYQNEQLVSLIIINKVTFDQMTMYFENLIKILCSIIEDALIRAMSYMDKIGDEIYIDNTNILKSESFSKLLKVRQEMEREAIAEFSMLKFKTDLNKISELSSDLKKYFRKNDVFGLGEDNNLYVILSGTGSKSIFNVTQRLVRNGIDVEIV